MDLFIFNRTTIKQIRKAWNSGHCFYKDSGEAVTRHCLEAGTPVTLIAVKEDVEIKLPTRKKSPYMINRVCKLHTTS
jgi:hypothetical protein